MSCFVKQHKRRTSKPCQVAGFSRHWIQDNSNDLLLNDALYGIQHQLPVNNDDYLF